LFDCDKYRRLLVMPRENPGNFKTYSYSKLFDKMMQCKTISGYTNLSPYTRPGVLVRTQQSNNYPYCSFFKICVTCSIVSPARFTVKDPVKVSSTTGGVIGLILDVPCIVFK
jgi:hypothetical protein